jgi:cation transport regulator ChaB
MPYNSVNEIPAYVKKYSEKIQRQWMHVFNSTWKKLEKEGISKKDREARSFKAANSVLKTRFKKSNSMEKNTRDDYFNHLIDSFLGNLKG